MPKCTINGRSIEVKEGTTIMEAFYQQDASIAHYCYHPGLSIAGVCRLCIVDIEGNPRPQIACNTKIMEGMKITNQSAGIKEGVKWVLDFHLINHPLDCPICDQAGECGLQEQYMEYGKYSPEMAERKVKKRKVVDLGPTVVLDSERCILCARCTRFTEEVTKTEELGLFNRGDRTEVGCVEGKQLDNKYSLNTVDICPVGALTSKDFRFRQRVWYLKDADTICTGCSTGCNVKTYFNKEGFFRVKPVYNEKVNGHWMCDEGRDIYKFVNLEHRQLKASIRTGSETFETSAGDATKKFSSFLKQLKSSETAVVLTGQYTVEEYQALVKSLKKSAGHFFHWNQNEVTEKAFDGLLLRGDKNPNTAGLRQVLEENKVGSDWKELETGLKDKKIKTLIVAGPENKTVFLDLANKLTLFSQAENLVWLSAAKLDQAVSGPKNFWHIPLKTFVEKSGTFVNAKGLAQKFSKVTTVLSEALTLSDVAALLTGDEALMVAEAKSEIAEAKIPLLADLHKRPDQVELERRKKNEFLYKRGAL